MVIRPRGYRGLNFRLSPRAQGLQLMLAVRVRLVLGNMLIIRLPAEFNCSSISPGNCRSVYSQLREARN